MKTQEPTYGDPDTYTKEAETLIQRPDGTTFIQNDLTTYRRIELPSVERPSGLGLKWSGISRKATSGGAE